MSFFYFLLLEYINHIFSLVHYSMATDGKRWYIYLHTCVSFIHNVLLAMKRYQSFVHHQYSFGLLTDGQPQHSNRDINGFSKEGRDNFFFQISNLSPCSFKIVLFFFFLLLLCLVIARFYFISLFILTFLIFRRLPLISRSKNLL